MAGLRGRDGRRHGRHHVRRERHPDGGRPLQRDVSIFELLRQRDADARHRVGRRRRRQHRVDSIRVQALQIGQRARHRSRQPAQGAGPPPNDSPDDLVLRLLDSEFLGRSPRHQAARGADRARFGRLWACGVIEYAGERPRSTSLIEQVRSMTITRGHGPACSLLKTFGDSRTVSAGLSHGGCGSGASSCRSRTSRRVSGPRLGFGLKGYTRSYKLQHSCTKRSTRQWLTRSPAGGGPGAGPRRRR